MLSLFAVTVFGLGGLNAAPLHADDGTSSPKIFKDAPETAPPPSNRGNLNVVTRYHAGAEYLRNTKRSSPPRFFASFLIPLPRNFHNGPRARQKTSIPVNSIVGTAQWI